MRGLIIWTSCRITIGQVHTHDMPVQVQGDANVWIQFIRNLAVILGWVLSTTSRTLYPGKHSLPTVQETGWTLYPRKHSLPTVQETGWTIYPGKHSLPTVQEAGWESGPVRRGTKFSAAPVFDPRTIQLITSPYTHWVYHRRLPETHKMIKSKSMRSVGIVVLVRKPPKKREHLNYLSVDGNIIIKLNLCK